MSDLAPDGGFGERGDSPIWSFKAPVRPESGEPMDADLGWVRPVLAESRPAARAPRVRVFPPDIVSRKCATWSGMTAEIVQTNRRGRVEYEFCAPVHLLIVHERYVRHDGRTVIEGLPESSLQDCTRKLVFVPAGRQYRDWQEPRTLSRLIFFYIDPARFAQGAQTARAAAEIAPRLFFEDGTLLATVLKLATLIESRAPDHQPYIEALGVVLEHELKRMDAAPIGAQASASGGLAAWQRRKAAAYIEEHLAETISLEALADRVGLSACYFCRAFRRSFGVPPLRYQLNQRVERAKALLAKHAASVTDVGLSIGYSDASAFCTAFRRVTGVTPTAYRRSLG
jgi:AraC family transcriptional regulator